MILQALTELYDALDQKGLVPKDGWTQKGVSYGIDLSEDGTVFQLLPLCIKKEELKKPVPRTFTVPQIKGARSSGVNAAFLCDNPLYLLGISEKNSDDWKMERFNAAKELHQKLLGDVDTKPAQAICRFFDVWDPKAEHEEFSEQMKDLLKGVNLLFFFDGKPAAEYKEIADAWNGYYHLEEDEVEMPCLVSGKNVPAVKLHPKTMRIPNGQPTGTMLVSFNKEAFNSYGLTQGYNAAVSREEAFKWGTALQYLVDDFENRRKIGDMILVCWAANGNPAYSKFAMSAMMGFDQYANENDIINVFHTLADGHKADWDDSVLDPDIRFYILGLVPNTARLSVRFFYRDTFGDLMRNVNEHFEEMRIVKPDERCYDTVSLKGIMMETVRKMTKASDTEKLFNKELSESIFKSVIFGTPYPMSLINAVGNRIQKDSDVNYHRAAIIKMFYTRNQSKYCPKEVLQMELNPAAENVPYQLGRLFAVMEKIQNRVSPNLNRTIKDRYFTMASANTEFAFVRLVNLSEKHMKSLKRKSEKEAIYFSKLKGSIMQMIKDGYPKKMNVHERAAFQLGYYHQIQDLYTKKS